MSKQVADGSIFNSRYELLAVLGRGGMGVVYKALDRKMNEVVALKLLLPGVDLSPEVRSRFRDEARLAWKVSHRNVCKVHTYDEDEDVPFIVMELVEGIDLKRFLQKVGSMEWEDGFDVSLQVAEGLAAIHEVGIVHRDLKPANITRDGRGIVKVMDFGIAKGGTQPGVTDDGRLVCTIDYVSPEQILGTGLDPRSDLYSFGVVIYELFTGRVPFRGDTPAATMHKHVHEPPPLYGLAASLIPESLVPVLEVALHKDRSARFKSVEEMRDALVRARNEMRRRGTSPVAGNGGPQESRSRRPFSGPYPREALMLVPALVRALGSADRGTRVGAAEALARTPDPSSREALEAAVSDEDREVRECAKEALRRLTRSAAEASRDHPNVGISSAQEAQAETSGIEGLVVVRPESSDDASLEPESEPDFVHENTPALPARPDLPQPPLPHRFPRIPRWVLWLVGLGVVIPPLFIIVANLLERRDHPQTASAPTTVATTMAASPPIPEVSPSPIPIVSPTVPSAPPTLAPPPRPPATPRPTTTTLPPPPTTVATPAPTPTQEPPAATLPPTPAPTLPPTPVPTPPPPLPGALVEASDPALARPVCAVCPPPQLPLIAEDPRYLPALRKTGGLVELRVLVDENGRVVEATPLKGEKALADAALKAVRLWKYAPGTKQGVKVKVWLLVPIRFELPR